MGRKDLWLSEVGGGAKILGNTGLESTVSKREGATAPEPQFSEDLLENYSRQKDRILITNSASVFNFFALRQPSQTEASRGG